MIKLLNKSWQYEDFLFCNRAVAERGWIIDTLEKIVEHLNKGEEPKCICDGIPNWHCPIHGAIKE